MGITLIPGDGGRYCPGYGERCDECDFLICCTNFGGLCDRCFEEDPTCQWRTGMPPREKSPDDQ